MDSQAALDIIREVGQRERTSSTEMNTSGEYLQSLSPRQQPFTIIVTQELETLNKAILNLNSEVKAFSNQMMDLKLITNPVLNSIEMSFSSTKFFVVLFMMVFFNFMAFNVNFFFCVVLGLIMSLLILKFNKKHQGTINEMLGFFL